MLRNFGRVVLASLAVSSITPATLLAQDALVQGLLYGTRPPSWVTNALRQDPTAFQFKRGWLHEFARAKEIRYAFSRRGEHLERSWEGAAAANGAVGNVLSVPVIPLLFSNTPTPPYPTADLNRRLFSGGPADITLTSFYREMSHGVFMLTGTVLPWTRVSQPDSVYEGDENGSPPALGRLLREALDEIDKTVDFSIYDRNRDKIVDVVAFVQPKIGGECRGSSAIWSHKWTMSAASGGGAQYQTNDGVTIMDYMIQPALDCDGENPVGIGVFAHELGHAIGLPDLYSTSEPPQNSGIGYWGLMSYGMYNLTDAPAHLEAWSRAELGWTSVQPVTSDATNVTLPPVFNTDGIVLRVNIPSKPGEYFLLENRQRLGSDKHLLGSGLLVWHIDSTVIERNRSANTLQNDTRRRAVALIAANGLDALSERNRLGDPTDVFPGPLNIASIDDTTRPSLRANDGAASGIRIHSIREAGDRIVLDVTLPRVIARGAPARPNAPAASQPAVTGPSAIVRFLNPVTDQDLQWLRTKGLSVLHLFKESNAVFTTLPATQSADLKSLNKRIESIDVQMKRP